MATKRKVDDSPSTSFKKKRTTDNDGKNGNESGEKFRFLLVGRTGSGKSSTGNTILGGPHFTTEVSFSSVTEHCQLRSAVRLGATIDVMDCPGLFDTHTANEEVASTILEALSSMEPGPDVIAYVIEVGSYTEEEFSAYRRLTALMDDVTDYVVIILTHADRLKGADIWQKLQQAPPHLQTVLNECDHRAIAFDNTLHPRKLSQLKYLLREARKLKLQNDDQPYTLELDNDAEDEAEERLLSVEKTETRRKMFVQKLIRKKAQVEQSLVSERQNWARRSEEQEESLNRKESILNKKMKDLSERLKTQTDLNEELEEEVDSLKEQLQDQRWAQGRS